MKPSEEIRIWLPGTPVAKARARVTFRNARAQAYTPESTKAWERGARCILDSSLRKNGIWQGPMQMQIVIFILRPASAKKRQYPAVRPDGDNYEKAVLDALNGRLFNDDGQVVDLRWMKLYTDNPAEVGVEITASQICSLWENEGRKRHMGVSSGG